MSTPAKTTAKKAVKSGNPRKAAAGRAAAAPRPVTLDHLRKKEKPKGSIKIILNEDAAEALAEARQNLEQAAAMGAIREVLDERTQIVRSLEEAAQEYTMIMKFQAIGRKAYGELVDLHPPTDEQNAEHRELTKQPIDPDDLSQGYTEGSPAPYNIDTFAPALISASTTEPEWTPEEVVEITSDWSENEYMVLWVAASGVNSKTRVQFWGKG